LCLISKIPISLQELSVQRQQLRVQRLSSEKAHKFEDPKLEEREKILKITLNDKQATRDLLSKELHNIEVKILQYNGVKL
jgi:hypothetical protein